MRVGVVAVPGVLDSAFASVVDILRVAEALRPPLDAHIPPIHRVVLGVGATAETANGLTIPVERALGDSTDDLDVLVVPALGVLTVPELVTALGRPDVHELVALLRSQAGDVPTIAGACTGTFLLADAGRLRTGPVTTSWWLADEFRRRHPEIELDTERMVVPSERVLTAGAAFAHIDLALTLVARVSPVLAELVARRLLIDDRPARSADAAGQHLDDADGLVSEFEVWIRTHLDESLSIPEVADALGTTRRTLERHVRERTGRSPHELLSGLRVERALHLRRTSERSWDQIAPLVGYASGAALRRRLRTAAL